MLHKFICVAMHVYKSIWNELKNRYPIKIQEGERVEPYNKRCKQINRPREEKHLKRGESIRKGEAMPVSDRTVALFCFYVFLNASICVGCLQTYLYVR